MKKISNLSVMVVLLILLLNFSCDEIDNPLIPTQVNINDVWISHHVDNDSDSYYSDARVYYTLNCNEEKVKCYSWLGYKLSEDVNSNTYTCCFQSTDFYVENGEYVERYILISTFYEELPRDRYDFLLVIHLTSEPDDFEDKADLNTDNDLHDIPLEPAIDDTVGSLIIM
jgi:hypothetical protein